MLTIPLEKLTYIIEPGPKAPAPPAAATFWTIASSYSNSASLMTRRRLETVA